MRCSSAGASAEPEASGPARTLATPEGAGVQLCWCASRNLSDLGHDAALLVPQQDLRGLGCCVAPLVHQHDLKHWSAVQPALAGPERDAGLLVSTQLSLQVCSPRSSLLFISGSASVSSSSIVGICSHCRQPMQLPERSPVAFCMPTPFPLPNRHHSGMCALPLLRHVRAPTDATSKQGQPAAGQHSSTVLSCPHVHTECSCKECGAALQCNASDPPAQPVSA